MARNAMPPPGDTDGAVRSDEAGEAPHSVVVLPATSDLSSTLRPLVERERSERGDEDGAVGVVSRGMATSSNDEASENDETSESRDGDSRADVS